MPLSEDEVSLSNEEFIVPEDPVEQERFKRCLMATANSLKKKQQQLQADQDLLANKWTEVLVAEEYELERPSKSYPKRRLLPHLVEEALKPTSPAYEVHKFIRYTTSLKETSKEKKRSYVPVANCQSAGK